jgi:maltose alpha-D-glucosyltransferase/alpha-amylase
MSAYGAAMGGRRDPANRALLDLFLIEKAAYEIGYEAANRPTWLRVPLAGLSRLMRRVLHQGQRRHG